VRKEERFFLIFLEPTEKGAGANVKVDRRERQEKVRLSASWKKGDAVGKRKERRDRVSGNSQP